jgi:hypothetical protein
MWDNLSLAGRMVPDVIEDFGHGSIIDPDWSAGGIRARPRRIS